MLGIIDFLLTIEKIAGDTYSQGANYFKDNKLVNLLNMLAEDEAFHFHIMGSASDYIKRNNLKFNDVIILDEETKNKITNIFYHYLDLLNKKELNEFDMMDCILESEYSEWNDIFLYVITSLSKISNEFKYVAAKMQYHLNKIEKYILIMDNNKDYILKLQNIKRIWDKKILIIDDEDSVRFLLRKMFEKKYMVDEASDGEEGLELLKNKYYDVILSDIDMPKKTGVELYKDSLDAGLNIKEKIIYITANKENEKFFKVNNLAYFFKPFSVKDIKQLVENIILKT